MSSSTSSMVDVAARPALRSAQGWVAFLAHSLFVLAAWTVTIKYLFPLAFAAGAGEPLSTYLYWDLWPVAHVWLGWALLRWPWYTSYLAVTMAVAEIAIIVTLFAWFLAEPEWTIWRTNWFINKLFILLAFVLILGTFTLGRGVIERHRQALKQHSSDDEE